MISENLHRSDLTALQRDVQAARWIQLTGLKVSQGVTPPGGIQPRNGGIREAERTLGINRMDAQRAVKVASLSAKAKPS